MRIQISFQQSTPAGLGAATLEFHDELLTVLSLTFADDVLDLITCLHQRVAHSPATKQLTN